MVEKLGSDQFANYFDSLLTVDFKKMIVEAQATGDEGVLVRIFVDFGSQNEGKILTGVLKKEAKNQKVALLLR